MDRTEEVEKLKKELFRLRFEVATTERGSEKRRELEEEARRIHKRIGRLLFEIHSSEGQMGFAFSDTIDDEQIKEIDNIEGRKMK